MKMESPQEIKEIEKFVDHEDASKLNENVGIKAQDNAVASTSKAIVPFKTDVSNSEAVNQSNGLLNIWMMGAGVAIVAILGATLFATAQDAYTQQIQSERAPASNRFFGLFWSNSENSRSIHDVSQLMQYLFIILIAYCGSEMFSHVIHNEHNLLF